VVSVLVDFFGNNLRYACRRGGETYNRKHGTMQLKNFKIGLCQTETGRLTQKKLLNCDPSIVGMCPGKSQK